MISRVDIRFYIGAVFPNLMSFQAASVAPIQPSPPAAQLAAPGVAVPKGRMRQREQLGSRPLYLHQGLLSWLFKGSFKVCSGTAELHISSYGTDFDISKIISLDLTVLELLLIIITIIIIISLLRIDHDACIKTGFQKQRSVKCCCEPEDSLGSPPKAVEDRELLGPLGASLQPITCKCKRVQKIIL